MTVDPYQALGLEHTASKSDIKHAYRKLASQLHPDKLTRIGATKAEIQEASNKFVAIAAAYSILSDESKKRQYDHIYKYGGFDHLKPTQIPLQSNKVDPTRQRYGSSPAPKRHHTGCKQTQTPQKGIGYAVYDPITFLLSQGKVRSKTVAGIAIPSRIHRVHGGSGGLKFSVSNGQIQKTNSGTLKLTSKTTEFANGKKLSRSETTTIHRDGTKEVVIAGDGHVERRVSAVRQTTKRKRRPSNDEDDLTRSGSIHDDSPWYMNAWNGVRDTVQMCNCTAISVQ